MEVSVDTPHPTKSLLPSPHPIIFRELYMPLLNLDNFEYKGT